MTFEKNIGAGLLHVAQYQGNKPAILAGDGSLSYAGLGRFIIALATVMRRHGVGRGSCVAIQIEDPRGMVVGIAASSLLGAAWTEGGKGSLELVASYVTHTLVEKRPLPGVELPGKVIMFDPKELGSVKADEIESFQGFEDESRMSRIGFSSGTTGQKKAICLSAALEWRHVSKQYAGVENDRNIISMALFPASSAAGIGQRIHTLLSGGTVVEGWVPELLKAGRINMIKGSPAQFSRFMRDLNQAGISTKLPLAVLGGGRPSAEFMKNMRDRFHRIAIGYASTEMGGVAAYPNAEHEDYDGRLEPRDDIHIEIVDDDGKPVPTGETGHLRMKFDVSMPRYLDSPASAQAFKDGWFFPGDLARLTKEGFLYIEGRSDDATNIGGIKVNLLLYDDFIQAFPGIDDGYSFVKPDEMGVDKLNIIARFRADADKVTTAKRLTEEMVAAQHLVAIPAAVYASDKIPRTETGKPAKHAALRLAGTLEPLLVTVRGSSAAARAG